MSFSNHEQILIIENQIVSGVSSADIGYGTQTDPLSIAGIGYIDSFISGPTEGQLEISRYMLGEDFIKDIDDESNLTGGIIFEGGRSIGFRGARKLNHTISCNVGEIPEIRNSFKVYGNLGGGISPYVNDWSSTKSYNKDDIVTVRKNEQGFIVDSNGFADEKVYIANDDNPSDIPPSSGWTEITNNTKLIEKLNKPLIDREYTIPTQGSIDIQFNNHSDTTSTTNTLSEFDGLNAILGFNYARGIDLESLYALREDELKGKPLTDYEAIDTQIIYPIKTTFDFTVSFDNYKMSDMRAFLDYQNWSNGRIEQDIIITMKDPEDDAKIIATYALSKVKLLSESITSQSDGETVLNVSFEGFDTDPVTPDGFDSARAGVYIDDANLGSDQENNMTTR